MKLIQKNISAAVKVLEPDIIDFISELVQVPTLPGDEGAVQGIVAGKLEALELEVDTIPITREALRSHPAFSDDGFPYENRSSVVGRWRGSGSGREKGRSLIFNGHVDVVATGDESLWRASPWSGSVEAGRIFGRGSADMKAGLAAAIFAVEVLKKTGIALVGDLLIESVAGEETGGCGTLATIVNGYRADAVIITEPTRLRLCPVQSGALSFRIKVEGRSIHACMKNRGISALEKFFLLFQAMEAFEKTRHQRYHNPLYEDPMNVAPINVGVLRSGDWPSTVPDKLVAEGRFGIFPGESVIDARADFMEMIERAAAADPWLRTHPPHVEWFEGQFESGQTPLDHPVMETLSSCHMAVTGEKPGVEGVTYGSDLRLFTNHGHMPAVLYGPGDVSDAHTANESISIKEVLKAVEILALTAVNWCGR
jgi:acetylornithine deacetylase